MTNRRDMYHLSYVQVSIGLHMYKKFISGHYQILHPTYMHKAGLSNCFIK